MKNWTLTLIISLGMVSLAQAQADTGVPADAGESEPAPAAVTTEAEETVEYTVPEGDVLIDFTDESGEAPAVSRDAETISVDFPDEDVRTIIRSVADMYELNVVIPDSLVGNVSIKLRNVTWRQVFEVVLEPLNFTYVEDRNIIKIKSREELMAEPVDTRVFVINFASAGEMKNAISPLVDAAAGGKTQVDVRSNALIITERPSRMNSIQEIIERLDRPTEQVMIESKFIEVNNIDEKNLGIDWASLNGYQVSAGPFERDYMKEVSSGSQTTAVEGVGIVQGSVSTDLTTKIDTAVFSADQFSVVLSALKTNNDIELVTNPTVVTLNNSPAQINIGRQWPIPSYRYNDEQGSFEVSGFEYKDIGVNLNVTPQINSAGFINMNIKPEISSTDGSVSFGGASGAVIPIIKTRRTQSTVTVKSGYTLAIGGLMQNDTTNRTTSVPILGDIPGLGRLFSSEGKSVDSTNLIVFITAKILSASGASYEDVFAKDRLISMGVTEKDIPGYELPETESKMVETVEQRTNEVDSLKKEDQLNGEIESLEAERERLLKERMAPENKTIRRNYQ